MYDVSFITWCNDVYVILRLIQQICLGWMICRAFFLLKCCLGSLSGKKGEKDKKTLSWLREVVWWSMLVNAECVVIGNVAYIYSLHLYITYVAIFPLETSIWLITIITKVHLTSFNSQSLEIHQQHHCTQQEHIPSGTSSTMKLNLVNNSLDLCLINPPESQTNAKRWWAILHIFIPFFCDINSDCDVKLFLPFFSSSLRCARNIFMIPNDYVLGSQHGERLWVMSYLMRFIEVIQTSSESQSPSFNIKQLMASICFPSILPRSRAVKRQRLFCVHQGMLRD